MGNQRIADQGWRWVLRLAYRQGNVRLVGRRGNALLQAGQFLERIGLQFGEMRVQGRVRVSVGVVTEKPDITRA